MTVLSGIVIVTVVPTPDGAGDLETAAHSRSAGG
jgi:hypothetical protein